MIFRLKVIHSAYKIALMILIFTFLASACMPIFSAPINAFAGISAPIESIANYSSLLPVFPPESTSASFIRLDLIANIETVGVVVSGINLPKTAQLMYRQSSDPNWHTGHPLMRIDDGRLVGSLFGLSPATSYNIKVVDGAAEIVGSAVTQPDELQFTPSLVLHVNDDAPAGGDGSVTAPFRTIQEGVTHASPGTQVLVADGIYHEAVSFPASGTVNNWIQVKAEGGGAILDGAENLSGNIWTAHETRSRIWFAKVGGAIDYLARDQNRFYMYDDLTGLLEGRGHNRVAMNEGWYFEAATSRLYVRSLDNPSNHTWQVPRINHAFDAAGRDWLWIEGFEIRFYGSSDGCGVCANNASHIVIRRNRIHNLQKGVFIEWTGGDERGNDSRIEYNEIYDPSAPEWPWNAVKGTSMEGTAIIVRGHFGAIVRGNEVHHFFNGIYTGSSGAMENSALAFDADIYNNRIHHITDDALEPEGACVNQRFRNNLIDTSYVGISLAPITQGPVWVLRSVYANYTGRGIKWDRNSDGVVLIYHNTFWTDVKDVNGMDFISPAYNAVLHNNIFKTSGYAFKEMPTGSTGNDWDNDNWYTTLGSTGPHFKWENKDYNTIAQLCAAARLECKGYEDPPGLSNPTGGDFTLLSSSPNVDRGVVIPGINDNYSGRAPDVGAYEFVPDPAPVVSSILRSGADPTDAADVNFTVTFSESVTGVDTVAPFKDFGLVPSPGVTGASITSITPVSGAIYTVGVNTGSGNGTIRLDLVDDDSIVDAVGNPLGGVGAGNGNFGSGEFYTIEKNLPVVTGILRADPDPTAAGIVHFAVTFSKAVSGVDVGDFALTAAGGVSGATLGDVSGSGTAYTVAVNTGTGDGTLRLDLLDDDSILDEVNNPLNGVGAGNGSYAAGEIYTIDKNAPVVVNSLRVDPNPTSVDTVAFTVNFSEPVSGVDAGDFSLAATGDISGAAPISVGMGGLGNTYNIVVNTGRGNGTLRLDVVDNDSITDSGGQPLGGAGAGNGSFSGGEAYMINKPAVNALTETFRSNGTNDGWVLESSEESNRGGSKNSIAGTFNLGDDRQDRQYRAILHFPTASLPDNAVITMVILTIKRQGLIGTDPFDTHQNINIDIQKGYFGSAGLFGINGLDLSDFQVPASKSSAGTIYNNPVNGWYWAMLDNTAIPYVNLTGVTQFRLGFQVDDNDDRGDDYLKFFSGNYKAQSDRPQLQVEYYVPR